MVSDHRWGHDQWDMALNVVFAHFAPLREPASQELIQFAAQDALCYNRYISVGCRKTHVRHAANQECIRGHGESTMLHLPSYYTNSCLIGMIRVGAMIKLVHRGDHCV